VTELWRSWLLFRELSTSREAVRSGGQKARGVRYPYMVVLSAVVLSMALPGESSADTEMTIGPQGRTTVLQRMQSEIALISNRA